MCIFFKLGTGGIRGTVNIPHLGVDTLRVTMWDGSIYYGLIGRCSREYVPWFLQHNSLLYTNFYFIITEPNRHYALYLTEVEPYHQHIVGLHNPMHSWIRIGNNLYLAENFGVYPVNQHNHRSTIGNVEGDFPGPHHIYIVMQYDRVYASHLIRV